MEMGWGGSREGCSGGGWVWWRWDGVGESGGMGWGRMDRVHVGIGLGRMGRVELAMGWNGVGEDG